MVRFAANEMPNRLTTRLTRSGMGIKVLILNNLPRSSRMTTQPEFGFAQLITELLRGLADAAADRPAETDAQRFARHQTVIFSVMAFLPRDALETMVAGQCVMFDHLLRDATRDLLRSEAEPVKRRIRSQVTALGRSFLKHLEELRGLQARRGQQAAASPSTSAQ